MSKKAKEEIQQSKILTSQEQMSSFLKSNKDSHYNFEETIEYRVSSGSLLFDYKLGGGLTTGLHRFIGINEGGKTFHQGITAAYINLPRGKVFTSRLKDDSAKKWLSVLALNLYFLLMNG